MCMVLFQCSLLAWIWPLTCCSPASDVHPCGSSGLPFRQSIGIDTRSKATDPIMHGQCVTFMAYSHFCSLNLLSNLMTEETLSRVVGERAG